jgi:integrase/recombinase XerD
MPNARDRTVKKPGPVRGARYRAKPGAAKGNTFHKRTDTLAHLPITRAMDEHCEWMLVTGYSADTVRGRRIAIRRFIAWCDDRGLSDPKEITKPILERYQRHLYYYRKADGAPLSLGSQHACLTPLKTFFKWLAKENHILWNPSSELELPPQPKHLPRALLSVEDVEAILARADHSTVTGLRDRAMLEVLYSTGLRRTELANLRRYDADLSRLIVFVREGKGRKDRVVPLGERAALWLDKYTVESRPLLASNDCEALFVTDYGEPIRPDFLATKVRRYMEDAGIDKPGSCHLFRHACATHMLDNGADIRFIQTMLGHAALSSTERYTHVAIGKLQQIHAATHPAKLRRGSPIERARDMPAEARRAKAEALLEALLTEDDDDSSDEARSAKADGDMLAAGEDDENRS